MGSRKRATTSAGSSQGQARTSAPATGTTTATSGNTQAVNAAVQVGLFLSLNKLTIRPEVLFEQCGAKCPVDRRIIYG